MHRYIGHDNQVSGVEECRLIGGKGDGMRLLNVTNGRGLAFTVCADRCADISRLSFRGLNMSYLSPCGYVAPAYYDDRGTGFLKSFTTGFLTTCGLNAVGSPCNDAGEDLPLHGTIGNTPAEHIHWEKTSEEIIVHARVLDEQIFSHKLTLQREIACSLEKNTLVIRDVIENRGDTPYPAMILYHLNVGYPLLSEKAELHVPSARTRPRNERARQGLGEWDRMLPPQAGFEEQCYYHEFEQEGLAAIFNPDIDQGLAIRFDPQALPYFTEWKMLGVRDYVLGLEPGNSHPDGRDRMRADGRLVTLAPGERVRYQVEVEMLAGAAAWDALKRQ